MLIDAPIAMVSAKPSPNRQEQMGIDMSKKNISGVFQGPTGNPELSRTPATPWPLPEQSGDIDPGKERFADARRKKNQQHRGRKAQSGSSGPDQL